MEEQNNMSMNSVPQTASRAGQVIGVIIILLVILLGSLYFWNNRTDKMRDETLNSINSQSDSDTASAIEADLDNTDIDNLDAELNAS